MSKRHKVTDDKLKDSYFCTGPHLLINEKIPVYELTQNLIVQRTFLSYYLTRTNTRQIVYAKAFMCSAGYCLFDRS